MQSIWPGGPYGTATVSLVSSQSLRISLKMLAFVSPKLVNTLCESYTTGKFFNSRVRAIPPSTLLEGMSLSKSVYATTFTGPTGSLTAKLNLIGDIVLAQFIISTSRLPSSKSEGSLKTTIIADAISFKALPASRVFETTNKCSSDNASLECEKYDALRMMFKYRSEPKSFHSETGNVPTTTSAG